MRNPIFCLMGPTASGKTELAMQLIQKFPLEIISVDSAMIYREMDIGTAKPTKIELEQAPHHLIDICDPTDSYSAAQFCKDVQGLCQEIASRGHVPLLVGGTMMYFNALQQGLSELPSASESIRHLLLKDINQFGVACLHQALARVDKVSAQKIHPHDTQRIQRALEVYLLTGKPLSEHISTKMDISDQFINFILMPKERSWLHERIALRFEWMLKNGFLEEVKNLLEKWSLNANHQSMRCVGYRQIFDYLAGKYDDAMLIPKGIAATRQLAKRQLTWLRHWPSAYFLEAEDSTNINKIIAIMKEKYRA